MKYLSLGLMALVLLGAGCSASTDVDVNTEASSTRRPSTATTDQGRAQELAIEFGLKILEAGQAGVDATELEVWNAQAQEAALALQQQNFSEAIVKFEAAIAEMDAAIAAQN